MNCAKCSGAATYLISESVAFCDACVHRAAYNSFWKKFLGILQLMLYTSCACVCFVVGLAFLLFGPDAIVGTAYISFVVILLSGCLLGRVAYRIKRGLS